MEITLLACVQIFNVTNAANENREPQEATIQVGN
jgi:hypothetical protein